jgi:hypothetical protein
MFVNRILVFLSVSVSACGPSVESCPHFPRSDCCSSHADCFDFYGSELPYCHQPGREIGGTCSECVRDNDCASGSCGFDADGSGSCS